MIHVALNLVFLVPGRDRRDGDLRPRADAAPGRACRTFALTALVNREARASSASLGRTSTESGRAGAGAQPHRVGPRRAAARAAARRARRARPRALARLHRAAARARPRVTTIHDLNYSSVPEAHFGVRGLGHARARAGRRPPLAPRPRRRGVHARRPASPHLGIAPGKIDVVPLGAVAAAAAPTPEAELRARLGLGDRPVVLSVSAPSGRTRTSPRLLEALARDPSRAAAGARRARATRRRTRRSCASSPRELGVAAACVPGVARRRRARGALRARRRASSFPSLYEGFGLPVLEAMARGVPGRLLEPLVAARGGRRRGAAVRPRGRAAIAAAIERLLGDGDLRERLAAAGRERAATLHVGAHGGADRRGLPPRAGLAVGLGHRFARRADAQLARVGRESGAGALPQRPRSTGAALAATTPLTPSSPARRRRCPRPAPPPKASPPGLPPLRPGRIPRGSRAGREMLPSAGGGTGTVRSQGTGSSGSRSTRRSRNRALAAPTESVRRRLSATSGGPHVAAAFRVQHGV